MEELRKCEGSYVLIRIGIIQPCLLPPRRSDPQVRGMDITGFFAMRNYWRCRNNG